MGLPEYGVVQRSLTCAQMIDEVQALTGTTDPDEPLATEARITRWLNDAQRYIVKKCPGIESLMFKNTTSVDITQSLAYEINDVTGGDFTTQDIAHIWDVWLLNGSDSRHLHYLPTDEFDALYPDPTSSEIPISLAQHWTRRGGQIEIMPLSACAFCDKDLRFDGDFYPRDFTEDSSAYSDISMSVHEGLIFYAVAKYYQASGQSDVKALKAWKDFYNADPRDEESMGWLDDFIASNDRMEAWDGNFLFEV